MIALELSQVRRGFEQFVNSTTKTESDEVGSGLQRLASNSQSELEYVIW